MTDAHDPGVDLLANALRPVINIMARHKWMGLENIPASGPAIVCPNHLSHVDPILIGHYLYNSGRLPYFLAKSSLFKFRPAGWALTRGGQIPVLRDTRDASKALTFARQAIAEGKLVVIYPEGTLTRDPELWPMRGRTGAARLALETGAPVIPMAHWGIQKVLAPYSKAPKIFPRRQFTVTAGKPVDLSAYADRSLDGGTLREATSTIQDATVELLAKLRGETPPERRFVYRGAKP
ncbi:lysophospholipid acyltransferase family protein [Saxibacter everestensis]|uniref:Lysophospholipid acyltransferase family protein n=1 Tax=Saxibacter everestensis TaxID=2909229 RepID=A0ABY8QXU2_9MICO|nr:lysophospholipid acyltransferase family protein [Brevibacteriaceae bacterium ZFBP1038]